MQVSEKALTGFKMSSCLLIDICTTAWLTWLIGIHVQLGNSCLYKANATYNDLKSYNLPKYTRLQSFKTFIHAKHS